MKIFRILSFLLLVSFIGMGNSCQTVDSTVVLPEGPTATQLNKTKDEQIKELTKQTEDLKVARESEKKEAAKAASSLKGIDKAREYLPDTPAKEAIGEESKLAQNRLPKDDPEETVRALERVVLLITGQRDAALQKYKEADSAAQKAREEITRKDKEIQIRDNELKVRDEQIVKLNNDAQLEKEKHKNDIENLIKQKDKEKVDLIKEFESKERAQWVLWTRIAGLGLIVVGALVMAVLKALPEGGGLIGAGVIIGLVSIFIDWLTKQAFFPWLMGLLVFLILVAGGYFIYRSWKTKTLHAKTVAALQDFRDESVTLGQNAWEKISEHMKYRLGDKNSFWGKEQMKEVAALGLINPKAEESLKVDKLNN